ncbi:uncharacterized protein CTRU02_211753 [Colletotrichum truncatum]|uniref:Uncharacterized protein n=1 Tax=Colletotrichum truncatum TaxID=5467 RepID=A0ACC3YLK1_COLTU
MSAPESYQLESLSSEVDAGKPPSPTTSIDPSQVRWLENQRSRGWEVCKIILRLIGLLLCTIVLVICLAWYSAPQPDTLFSVWPGLCLFAALPSFFWDLAEFLTICARHGRGITPKALIGVELVFGTLSAVAAGWVSLQLTWQNENFGGNAVLYPLNLVLTECIFMGINALIHAFLFFRACIERRREIRRRRPRVMFLPETGQTVYVVAKAFPKQPTWRSQYSARTPSFPLSPQSPTSQTTTQPPPRLRVDVPKSPPQLFPPESPPPLPERPSAVSAIKRKPVRGVPPNIAPGDIDRHLRPGMRPPPEDYEPDEAELERMRRGDAQPQLIMPGDVDLKFATSATGMTPADADSREGKFRVNKTAILASLGESSSQGHTSGRTRSL